MPTTIAFDSKEFSIKGVTGDYFCLIGAGVKLDNSSNFRRNIQRITSELSEKYSIGLSRPVFDSHTLIKKIGGYEGAKNFCTDLINGVRPHIQEVKIYHTNIPPYKVKRLFVYNGSSGHQETMSPIEYMKRHKTSYVSLCAWKYCETPDDGVMDLQLDYYEGQKTKAWDILKGHNPKMYFRGDLCNPSISLADCILFSIDYLIKSYYYNDRMKVCDESIRKAIRSIGLDGDSDFIGQPHFEKIIPYSSDMANTCDYSVHPIIFVCPEKRPEAFTNQEYREMLTFMPVMDEIVRFAFEHSGSIKFFDISQDYLIAKPGDYFAYWGLYGKGIFETLKFHSDVLPLDLSTMKK